MFRKLCFMLICLACYVGTPVLLHAQLAGDLSTSSHDSGTSVTHDADHDDDETSGAQDNDGETSSPKALVKFHGHAAKFDYQNVKQVEKLRVELNGLFEVPAGADLPPTSETLHRNSIETFSNQAFYWDKPVTTTLEGDGGKTISVIGVDFHASPLQVNNGTSSMTLETLLFVTSGTLTLNGQPVLIDEGSLKFNAVIQDWPFLNQTNELVLELAVKSPWAIPTPTPGSNDVDLGGGFAIKLVDSAVVGGQTVTVRSVVTIEDGVMRIYIVFPNFQGRLDYDPVITSQSLGTVPAELTSFTAE